MLTTPEIAATLRAALDQLGVAGDFITITGVIMPDHVHLLGALGNRLSLARTIGKLKCNTRNILAEFEAHWQENFYEHRLRDSSAIEPYARYIFLNPYRAKLLGTTEIWRLWWRAANVQFDFEGVVAQTGVPLQWLDDEAPVGAIDE